MCLLKREFFVGSVTLYWKGNHAAILYKIDNEVKDAGMHGNYFWKVQCLPCFNICKHIEEANAKNNEEAKNASLFKILKNIYLITQIWVIRTSN